MVRIADILRDNNKKNDGPSEKDRTTQPVMADVGIKSNMILDTIVQDSEQDLLLPFQARARTEADRPVIPNVLAEDDVLIDSADGTPVIPKSHDLSEGESDTRATQFSDEESQPNATAPIHSDLDQTNRASTIKVEDYFADDYVRDLYRLARFAVLDAMDNVKSDDAIDPDSVKEIFDVAEKMVHCISKSQQLYRVAVYTRHMEEDFITHMVNVAIFSVMLGKGMGLGSQELVDLCVVAMVHDVGMLAIPFDIIHSDRILTEEERSVIKTHPRLGRQIMRPVESVYPWIPLVVSQEHERVNGKGYPLGLTEKNIHPYAKIIGLADEYEALTHDRRRRRRYLPYDAIKIILEQYKGYFNRDLLKILIKRISVFPLGAYVQLNTNEIGVVVETIEEKPLRPKIQLKFDMNHNKLEHGATINLAKNPLLFITKSVYEEDIYDMGGANAP